MSSQYRNFEIIVYPDDEKSDEYLKRFQKICNDWAYILHDRDKHDDGSLKKPHIHAIGRTDKITLSGMAYHVGCPVNMVTNVKDWVAAVRYLIHADDDRKAPYDIADIVSNFSVDQYFVRKKSEEQMIMPLLEFIEDNEHVTVKSLSRFALDNHLWSAFRRNYTFLKDYMQYENTDKEYHKKMGV